jgi:hypothetical protein
VGVIVIVLAKLIILFQPWVGHDQPQNFILVLLGQKRACRVIFPKAFFYTIRFFLRNYLGAKILKTLREASLHLHIVLVQEIYALILQKLRDVA